MILDESLQITQEKAIIVGIWNFKTPKDKAKEHIDELAFLATTAGAKSMKTFLQRVEKPKTSTFLGKGKLEEIKEFVEQNKVELILFDEELSPTQIRNLDKFFKNVKLLDRSGLILYIFSQRAQTAQAKAQVELAQLEYLLPRLAGMWTHLERQRGGIGMRGGAGEKEIETDRRIVRNKITILKKKLEQIDKQNKTRRKHRGAMVRVSLVGYTNAGKSTLMNVLTKSDVFVQDALFATLDTTVRKVVYKQTKYLLSDTVGFIRKLPHTLVECFKSTLDEVREADVLLHVVDVSHPNYEEHIQVVKETLIEIEAKDQLVLLVLNKVDQLSDEDFESLENSLLVKENAPVTLISAHKKFGINELREKVVDLVEQVKKKRYVNTYSD